MSGTAKTCTGRQSPYYSFVLPVWRPLPSHLAACLASIGRQTCRDFELCIMLDGPLRRSARRTLDGSRTALGDRCQIHEMPSHAGISAASNAAAEKSHGEWLVFVDQDDTVEPDLLENFRATSAETDALYTDEDKLFGPCRAFPFRKPGPSLHNLMACNYYAHCRAFRREAYIAVGGHDSRFDGAQDWDLFLRFTKAGLRIRHVAKTLYHWRAHIASTAFLEAANTAALEPARQCLRYHFPDRVFTDARKRVGPLLLAQPGFFIWRMKQSQRVVFPVCSADGISMCCWENGRGVQVTARHDGDERLLGDDYVVVARKLSIGQLIGYGVLSQAPWYFDPLATTVSFREKNWGKAVSGGVCIEDGTAKCAASMRRMGLSNVIWECDGPNPDLYLAKAAYARGHGELRNVQVTESTRGGGSGREVHLDAPVYIGRHSDRTAPIPVIGHSAEAGVEAAGFAGLA